MRCLGKYAVVQCSISSSVAAFKGNLSTGIVVLQRRAQKFLFRSKGLYAECVNLSLTTENELTMEFQVIELLVAKWPAFGLGEN